MKITPYQIKVTTINNLHQNLRYLFKITCITAFFCLELEETLNLTNLFRTMAQYRIQRIAHDVYITSIK